MVVPFFLVNAFAQRVPGQGGTFDPRREFIYTGQGFYIFVISEICIFTLHQRGKAVSQLKCTADRLAFDRFSHHGSR
ncbi:hypothetical protein D3C71_2032260 [compost metagenome]